MIYGYSRRNKLNKWGLLEMREVSLSVPPEALRALAAFLIATADEIETKGTHLNWHRHVSDDLCDQLGSGFVVATPDP